jgi:hypothetical protein
LCCAFFIFVCFKKKNKKYVTKSFYALARFLDLAKLFTLLIPASKPLEIALKMVPNPLLIAGAEAFAAELTFLPIFVKPLFTAGKAFLVDLFILRKKLFLDLDRPRLLDFAIFQSSIM